MDFLNNTILNPVKQCLNGLFVKAFLNKKLSGQSNIVDHGNRCCNHGCNQGRLCPLRTKNAKGILQIGHIVRFNPRYRAAKKAISEGAIGKVLSLSSRRNIPAAWTPEILNKIGPIVGDAIHDTDIMLWLTGDKIVSAYAQTTDMRGLKNPDIGQTMYRFASGATATLETVWCMPEHTPFDIDERMTLS